MKANDNMRPLLALTAGDPAGIGPEIVHAALSDAHTSAAMRLVVLGPDSLRPARVPRIASDADLGRIESAAWIDTGEHGGWKVGEAQLSGGRSALSSLRAGHELALARRVDALVTAPVSKEALHLAGEKVEGQTDLLGRWCGVERFEMMALAGRLCVMLLTRHMPLRRALDQVTTERVLDRLDLLNSSLKRFGRARPKLALAGLNPHAGEGGILGTEDESILRPAVARAREQGIDVTGPLSPDTVFLSASRGAYDGVLALYHDQAFIPIKLLAADGGVTVIAGLPYLRVSPVHGTAFDIAGQGKADPANLMHALQRAAEWTQSTPAAQKQAHTPHASGE
ncbi:MAG: 4-hydroxythreonine-4-phosphate dehydrogenase PdxA [Planctomycetes bacterium]|nr:4-hydroxythreonine-4-phosphate dehydrogenase PdxA [Planctomycetota bacterium]